MVKFINPKCVFERWLIRLATVSEGLDDMVEVFRVDLVGEKE